MRNFLLIAAVLFSWLSACKKNENDSGKICFSRNSTTLKITNPTNTSYSYFAMGDKIQPLINWVMVCNYNLPAESVTIKNLSEIPGYQDSDSLIIFWWDCINDRPTNNTQFIKLGKNQVSCKPARPL